MASQKRGFRRDRLISMLAIIGLVFQALMTAVMLPMPFGGSAALASEALSADTFSGSLVICTPEGLVRMTLDENGNPVKEPLSAGGCAVCDALVATTFALPVADILAPVVRVDAGYAPSSFVFRFVSAYAGAHKNRGPPYLA
ncbi:MAG: hypothetical protein P8Y47_05860 [Alphaproteobacteria bacterium]